ncbi:MAG: type 2 isopentenyl-diphosphate Delta-isomerase [Candidatus Iainarchaeum archaeon]|uniref:Isopentenyl-diphosphate delta-isomerase n=1 Tax=Candidatus Iainarchaeum sp. TaxID=3101447 RepID=A0A7T9DIZ4_9ARCH|nr:MAG: type 2 isopentenyl-diphosphate Delta-isomerase [Candidatus Diapherotrites archaeon]
MPTKDLTSQRKIEHVNIVLQKPVQFTQKTTGFEEMEVEYLTLPEIDAGKIDTRTTFLKHAFSFPFMVSSMTGGHEKTTIINRQIAQACEEVGIGMGLGSTRAAIENKKTMASFDVRKYAPNIFLACNIGVSNLKKYSSKQLQKLVDDLQCDAMIVHSNSAQEIVQHEGTPQFSDCLKEIGRVARELEVPVYVKEVGNGISPTNVKQLDKLPIAAIDVAGAGGTSWTAIESKRGTMDNKELGEKFWNVGIPTVPAVIGAKRYSKKPIIASGGVRSGQDVLKAMVLGASMSAAAIPIILAQDNGGAQKIVSHLEKLQREFRAGMFLAGAKNVSALHGKKYYLFGKTKEWVEQL